MSEEEAFNRGYQRGYDDGVQAGLKKDAYRWYSEGKAKDYLDRERECMELRKESERYKKALEEIARPMDPSDWESLGWEQIAKGCALVAEQALKGDG